MIRKNDRPTLIPPSSSINFNHSSSGTTTLVCMGGGDGSTDEEVQGFVYSLVTVFNQLQLVQ